VPHDHRTAELPSIALGASRLASMDADAYSRMRPALEGIGA